MDDKEITALAREYAECTKDKRTVFNICEYFLRRLSRRYCLVEKEAICKKWESVKDTPEDCNYEELGATWDAVPYLSRFYDEGYDCGQKDLLESLFPDLGKEVEK